MHKLEKCPCDSGQAYQQCCFSFIEGSQLPETPERLMRSRYTAYTKNNLDYIKSTMQGPAAEGFDKESALSWAKKITWLGLEVIDAQQNGDKGQVEFIAQYLEKRREKHIHEVSQFERVEGRWFYVDGEQVACCHGDDHSHHDHEHSHETPKVGRNDACPCGSGKKFKKR